MLVVSTVYRPCLRPPVSQHWLVPNTDCMELNAQSLRVRIAQRRKEKENDNLALPPPRTAQDHGWISATTSLPRHCRPGPDHTHHTHTHTHSDETRRTHPLYLSLAMIILRICAPTWKITVPSFFFTPACMCFMYMTCPILHSRPASEPPCSPAPPFAGPGACSSILQLPKQQEDDVPLPCICAKTTGRAFFSRPGFWCGWMGKTGQDGPLFGSFGDVVCVCVPSSSLVQI